MTVPGHNPLRALGAIEEILDAQKARDPLVVIVSVESPPELIGQRIVIRKNSNSAPKCIGSFGDESLDNAALGLGMRALDYADPRVDGIHELSDSNGKSIRVYVESHHPHPDLIIVGAGHIAQPLCSIGSLIGFHVIVIDDRPEFATQERFPEAHQVVRADFSDPFDNILIHPRSHVVLVTRGHKYDYECLRRLLRMNIELPYIGMIGSRRRVRATFEQLVQDGVSKDRIAKVQAPLGLDIGAETPAEIAISVAAEIVLLWRGGAGSSLVEKERVLDRFF
tara:strand:- start:4561 stop:5400 length:840 start_codon:yes stop_codon:yes gene_type:complete